MLISNSSLFSHSLLYLVHVEIEKQIMRKNIRNDSLTFNDYKIDETAEVKFNENNDKPNLHLSLNFS